MRVNLYREYMVEVESDLTILAALERLDAEAETEAEMQACEDELREALIEAADAGEWDLYSDLFKDLYGFRPREDAWHWFDR